MIQKSVITAIVLTMVVLIQLVCAGCGKIVTKAQMGGGYEFQVESSGSRAEVRNLCLKSEQIKAIVPGTHIPDNAPKASCYQVFFITSSTSAITNSITEFLLAKDEFDTSVTLIASARNARDAREKIAAVQPTPAAAAPLSPVHTTTPAVTAAMAQAVSKAATTAIVSDALEKNPEEVKARAEGVGKQLTEPQKEKVIDNLKEIQSETPNDKVKEGVNAAIESLQKPQ